MTYSSESGYRHPGMLNSTNSTCSRSLYSRSKLAKKEPTGWASVKQEDQLDDQSPPSSCHDCFDLERAADGRQWIHRVNAERGMLISSAGNSWSASGDSQRCDPACSDQHLFAMLAVARDCDDRLHRHRRLDCPHLGALATTLGDMSSMRRNGHP